MKLRWNGMRKHLLKVGLIVSLTCLALPGLPQVSATSYQYIFADAEAGGGSIAGTQQAISGSHMVWLDRDVDGINQVYYQQIGSTEIKQITTNEGLKDSPVVSEDRFGHVRILWEDKRSGTDGSNWDIYAYDFDSQTERKLNPAAGMYGHISIDEEYAVWVETSSSVMYLYDFSHDQIISIGKGRFPVISEGKVVYISASDGGLFLYTASTGQTERILELPYSQYVDWFAFRQHSVVWKQRDLDLKSQYFMMNLSANSQAPVALTEPSVKAKEYSTIYIGDGQAAWLEYRGSAVQVMGADLLVGQAYSVTNGNRDQQLLGFEGNRMLLVDDNQQLIYRSVIRKEIPSSYGGGLPASSAIEADGAKLVLAEGESNHSVRLEPFDLGRLDAKLPASSMRILSEGWEVVSERTFQMPANLTIRYDASDLTSLQIQKLSLYLYDSVMKTWRFVGGLADADAGELNAKIMKPGIYAIFLYEPTFKDLDHHWAKQPVEILAARWLVSGMGNGLFQPNSTLTRAQFTKLLVDAIGLEVTEAEQSTFQDVALNYWGHRWIEAAARAGWIQGYNGKFNPDEPLSREQMMVMIVQAMGKEAEALSLSDTESRQFLPHRDADAISGWAKPYAAWVVNEGIMQGADGKLHPQDNSSRAEGAMVIYQLLGLKGAL